MALAALCAAACGRTRPAAAPVPPAPTSAPGAAPAEPSRPGQPLQPGGYIEQGIASWYGYPFHGRQASSGEVFDMEQLVAAHRTLPFGSIVRVTNLNNGRQIEVRIIDRGPFVSGRIIDLSLAAARAIDMVGSGIAPVGLEVIASPARLIANFSVQIGAFQQRENAERLRAQLVGRYPVFLDEFEVPAGRFYRVRVGHVPTQQEAQQLAARLAREDGVQTFVVRLDGIQ